MKSFTLSWILDTQILGFLIGRMYKHIYEITIQKNLIPILWCICRSFVSRFNDF